MCCSPWGREKSDMTWQLNDDYIVNSSSESWNVERKCELSGPSKAKLGRAGVKQWTGVSSVFLFCFVFIQSLSCVLLFATPWITACQASLSFTLSQSLLKLMSIESVMPSNHLILCHPLLLLPSISPSIRVFSNELALCIRCQSIGASASVLPMNVQG